MQGACSLGWRTVDLTRFILAEILVLVGGAIQPAPVVPASTWISARLKYVQEQVSPRENDFFTVPAETTRDPPFRHVLSVICLCRCVHVPRTHH